MAILCGTMTCPGADACGNPGVCDPTTGVCTRVSTQPDGTLCDDGDACTADERCRSGRCTGGLPVNCSADAVGTTMLEPPITISQTRTLRDSFSWAATTPLKNFITQGPALYYALVYVEGKADLQTLDTMDIHYDVLPLFASERQKWMGQTGTLTPGFDGQGGGDRRDLQAGLTHEFGHALGLVDSCDPSLPLGTRRQAIRPCTEVPAAFVEAAMYPVGAPGATSQRKPSQAEPRALCSLYGGAPPG